MRVFRVLKQRFRSIFNRARVDRDLQREIDLHIEQLRKELIAGGMAEPEALLAATREFGSVALTKEQCRDTRRVNLFEDLVRDVAFALRALRKSPGFAATALLSLALGIGVNTAIYSFIDAIMMRALPVQDPQSLVIFDWRAKDRPAVVHSQHGDTGIFPYPFFESVGNHDDALSSIFAFADAGRLNLVVRNQAFIGGGAYVSGNYFIALGSPSAAGRLIGNADDRAGATPVAVISYRLWQQRFGGTARAIGQVILINRRPFTVAGVTAPEFYGVNPRDLPDVYLPLHSFPEVDPRVGNGDWFHEGHTYWVEILGRLRPGITLRQAEAAMATRFHTFVSGTAGNSKERFNLPALWLQEGGSGIDSLRRQYSKPLYILFAMTGLILAIACSNLANLLLSRATARRREIAVRLSLGAGRWRIIRQLLTESILMSVAGGILGLIVAALGIRFLAWLMVNSQDFALHVGIDTRILLFAFLLSVVAGLVFGLVPAIQATKVDVAPALKQCLAAASRLSRFQLSHFLVVGQIALSLLLVIAAALFVRTLFKLHSVSIGFNTEKLLVFNLDAGRAGYDERRGAMFYESLRQSFIALPGVRAATMTSVPLVAGANDSSGIVVPGMPAPPDRPLSTNVILIGPSFFDTMQIPILVGRALGEQDTTDAPPVVVVSEAFAKRFFPGRNAIGQHFAFEYDKPINVEIVGVAKNTLYASLRGSVRPVAYVSWSQALPGWSIGGVYYELRALGDPLALANAARQIVHQANPSVPVADLATQVHYIENTIATQRTFADLCTCFGLLALLIACVGLYGTMAYAVARRTNEIGIRIALGAQRGRVIWMVLREVVALSSIGLAIGLGVAWESAHLVASFLFGVRPNDIAAFGLSALILMTCALAAGYLPAWRASRIDPMQALRNE